MQKDEKKLLRLEVKQKLRALSDEQRAEKSLRIVRQAQGFLKEKGYKSACVYNSFSTEAQTGELIDFLLSEGIDVYLPRINGQTMHTVRFNANTKFFVNEWGISEPLGEDETDAQPEVIIMPLLAFDENMHRLGRGKGFYDVYLNSHTGDRVALAFECQRLNAVPFDEWDKTLDAVITEDRIIKRSN